MNSFISNKTATANKLCMTVLLLVEVNLNGYYCWNLFVGWIIIGWIIEQPSLY